MTVAAPRRFLVLLRVHVGHMPARNCFGTHAAIFAVSGGGRAWHLWRWICQVAAVCGHSVPGWVIGCPWANGLCDQVQLKGRYGVVRVLLAAGGTGVASGDVARWRHAGAAACA